MSGKPGSLQVALASLANVAEDDLQMSWAFFVFVAGTAVLLLALLPLTVVIAFTRRGAARLLALIPAGTMAGVVFFVIAGGVIMLVAWVSAAAVALTTTARTPVQGGASAS